MTKNPFAPAEKTRISAKIALAGPAGSGKTYTALRMASALKGGGRIAVIDTEHGSASLYADEFEFDVVNMDPPYHPKRFSDGIKVAGENGYTVVVIDGISPAWNGPGGVMEIVDKNAKGSNSWSGWAAGSPAHNELLQGILSAPMHLICTMRSKTEWALDEKNRPQKVGMAPLQRDGIDYEFTLAGQLDLDHSMTVVKARGKHALQVGAVFPDPGEREARILLEWLNSGQEPATRGGEQGTPSSPGVIESPNAGAQPVGETAAATTPLFTPPPGALETAGVSDD